MKLKNLFNHQLDESIIDSIKQKLGTITGKIVSSVSQLLTIFKNKPNEILTTIEIFEAIGYGSYESRVDTGAASCSMLATNIVISDNSVRFDHDGKTFNKPLLSVESVKNANGSSDRPFIEVDFKWNGKVYSKIKTSLADRSKMKFKLLIGRNLIKELKLPISINQND